MDCQFLAAQLVVAALPKVQGLVELRLPFPLEELLAVALAESGLLEEGLVPVALDVHLEV